METSRHRHLSSEFEDELSELRAKLLPMASKVEGLIATATEALVDRDSTKAELILVRDKEVDTLEKEVDELCIRILALRQPAATDLRHITTALKIVTDLERMGDLGVNICERVMELNEEPPFESYLQVQNMAEAAQEMLREALDAFVGTQQRGARLREIGECRRAKSRATRPASRARHTIYLFIWTDQVA